MTMASQYSGSPNAVSAMTLFSRLPKASCTACYKRQQYTTHETHIRVIALQEVHIVVVGQIFGAGATGTSESKYIESSEALPHTNLCSRRKVMASSTRA